MNISRNSRDGSRSRIGWYIRVGIYAAVLIVVVLLMNALRGQIPQAFGLTPIRVDALSVTEITSDAVDGASSAVDYAVTVRIVGRDSVATPVRLGQFRLNADGGTFQPYASDVLFDSAGVLRVARGDTVVGVFVFSLPANTLPKQLWWNP